MQSVREFRRQHSDSYNFNWLLSIQPEFQRPFEVTHESMRSLDLSRDQPVHQLAANLRRAFSESSRARQGIRHQGNRALRTVRALGDPTIMQLLDELLTAFVAQLRMKLPGTAYRPVYRLVA